LICITCAECGESFEIGEEFAGITEFCPACGALNDIPDTAADPGPDQPIESAPAVAASAPVPGRGIPAALWWTILIAAVGLFAVACVFLFSDNWESRILTVVMRVNLLHHCIAALQEDFGGVLAGGRLGVPLV